MKITLLWSQTVQIFDKETVSAIVLNTQIKCLFKLTHMARKRRAKIRISAANHKKNISLER